MGAIIAGFISRDGYIFATDASSEELYDSETIVKINERCGAFIGTPELNRSRRVRKVLDRYLSSAAPRGESGLSTESVGGMVAFLEEEFRKDVSFRKNPLTFILLLVGYDVENSQALIHILLKNKPTSVKYVEGSREVMTKFEIEDPVPADNLFYGPSELVHYLSDQLPSKNLSLDATKLLAHLCISEAQVIDHSLFPGVNMATLTRSEGFKWVTEEELSVMSSKTDEIILQVLNRTSKFLLNNRKGE